MAGEAHSALVGPEPRYGILGGTFDPPHVAHLAMAQEAYARLDLDRVYFVPSGHPPHKRDHPITAAADRCAMVARALEGDARFALSSVELERPGPSYTVDTLCRLRALWGSAAALYLILGWDMLLDLPRWHAPAEVVDATTAVVAAHRPGYDADPVRLRRLRTALPQLASKLILLPVPQLEISASEVRERVASSLPIRYLVPDRVIAYIQERGLYRAPDGSRAEQWLPVIGGAPFGPLKDAPSPEGDRR
jgi:nicotinate-nucleotide adenylyltransferase